MKHVLVVGAGVAGLTTAYKLTEKGVKVTVVEKEDRVGGLARSFRYGDFIFDIGPHRFHTNDQKVLRFIKFILGDDALTISRRSGVWMFGKYHDWPLRPNTIYKLPPDFIIKVSYDLMNKLISDAILKKENAEKNFEDYIINRYGPTLYKVFFKTYTEKFLFIPPDEIHREWAKAGVDRAIIDNRIKMDSLADTVRNALLPRPVHTEFLYPRFGVSVFSEKLAQRIQENGGKILTNAEISDIKCSGSKIDKLVFEDFEVAPDWTVWTAPITDLANMLGLSPAQLNYLSLICYNVEVSGSPKSDYQWCYYGDTDTIFTRVSIPFNFSKYTAPANKTGICAEVPCMKGDERWSNPEKLIDSVIEGLIKVGLAKKDEIEDIHVERVANAYPIYHLGYQSELEQIVEKLEGIENLSITGRAGTYWYNNMDNSIKMGMELVDKLVENPDVV